MGLTFKEKNLLPGSKFLPLRFNPLQREVTETGELLPPKVYSFTVNTNFVWRFSRNLNFSGFPDKVSHILQFITEVHSFYRQQRSLMKPVLVHCRWVGHKRCFNFISIYAKRFLKYTVAQLYSQILVLYSQTCHKQAPAGKDIILIA